MDKQPLGALTRVNLREYWSNEAQEFTPWLAEQIALLGQAIGMELDVEATEQDVGSFRADIVCHDLSTSPSQRVLIENQIEPTDHGHLGQLITYAAGLDAVSVVWIAENIREEHRAALDWLNHITGEEFNFFGVEIELWRIGDSPLAPKFNVVSKPNEWTKQVQETVRKAGLTPTQLLQLDFWNAFTDQLKQNSKLPFSKPWPGNWIMHAIGEGNVHLSSVASTYDSVQGAMKGGELRAELVIATDNAKDIFAKLQKERAAIETELGEEMVWHNPQDVKSCKVLVRKSVDLWNREDWPEQHRWLKEHLERIEQVLRPRVRSIRQQLAATEN